MKSLFKVSVVAAAVFLAACQDKPTQASADVTPGYEDTAYAIGVSFASDIKRNLDSTSEFGVTLDEQQVLKAINDTFAGKATQTEDEANENLQKFSQELQKKMQEKQQAVAAENKKAGDEYRATFAKEDGAQTTESGLVYKVETEGKGESPKATDTVVAHYEGTLIDGTKFDSSYDRGQPATFPLNQVVPGWTEMLQLMKVGSKVKVAIPPELGYGEMGASTIPGNATLIFTIELVEIKKAEK